MARDIDEWLAQLGLDKYAGAFAENEIDLEVLPELTNEDLKELGVPLGPRKKLSKAIAALSGAAKTDAGGAGGTGVDTSTAQRSSDSQDQTAAPGERRQVTVLFCDLAGFTKLSRELDPEVIHDVLNRYFGIVDGLIERYGGAVDKHIGDAVMAVFGAPISHGNDPERAVRAALAIHDAIPKLSDEIERSLQVHVGIASGQVVASGTGSDAHREYTVTGESVNLASRLQDLASAGETIISDYVHGALKHLLDCQRSEDVAIKGFEEPVAVWRVRGLSDTDGAQTKLSLVGRDAEVRQFVGVLQSCRETGCGQVVHIRGEAGIGKTRLGQELVTCAEVQGFVCHKGLVLDFGAGAGEDVISVIVRSLLTVPANASTDERESVVRSTIQNGLLAPQREAFLNDLINVPQPETLRAVYDAMENAARNQGKRETVAALVKGMSEHAPILVMVEDVHWSDEPTLAQLSEIAALTPECPTVLAITSRVEGDPLDPSWRSSTRGASLLTMDLSPLREADAIKLAAELSDASSELVQNCVKRAEGNPLFLEQLLRSVGERGEESIPGSVQSLVQARMDSLNETDRRALQAAAVLGQRFALEPLRRLIEQPDYECADLISHFLVRPSGEAYMFAHALIRDGAYATLLHTRARALHRRAADWFGESDTVLKAEHLDRAEDATAPNAYLDAARAQVAVHDFERALRLVERGIEITGEREALYKLYSLHGKIHRGLGAVTDATVAYDKALEVADTETQECRAQIGKAAALRVLGQTEETLEALRLAEASVGGLARERSQIEHYRGNISFLKGDIDDCIAQQKRALRFAELAASPEQEANALSGLGDGEYMRARMISAHHYFARCMETARANGLGAVEVSNLVARENTRYFQNDLATALENCRAGAKAAADVGLHRPELITRAVAAFILIDMKEFDEALAHADQSASLCRQIGARVWLPMALITIAKVQIVRGSRADAVAILEEAVVCCRQESPALLGPCTLGALAWATQDADRRRSALAEAQEMLRDGCVGHNHLWFYRDAMEASLDSADWDAAEQYAAALSAFTAAEPLPWSDFFIARTRALADIGRGDRSAETMRNIERLRQKALSVGFRLWLPALDAAMGP